MTWEGVRVRRVCVGWLVGFNGRGRVWECGNGVGGMSAVYWRRRKWGERDDMMEVESAIKWM